MAELRIKIFLDGGQFKLETGKIGDAVGHLEGEITSSFDSMIAKVGLFSLAANQIGTFVNNIASKIQAPIQRFSELETAITNVETLGVPNIRALQEGVIEAGNEIGKPLLDIAGGLYEVVSAGVDSANQIDFLNKSVKAAKAGIATTTEAIQLSSAVVKGYGEEWSLAESIYDQAFKTVELGQTNFGELAANMGDQIPLTAALKVETEELFGAYATLTGVTGNTFKVSTQLKALYSELSGPTKQLTDLIKAQGFASVEAAVAQRGTIGILEILKEATKGSATELNKYFGSQEAVNALLALTNAQFDTYREKVAEIAGATGAMNDAFEKSNDTIESQLQILENKFNASLIETVETFEPVIASALSFASALLDVDYEPFVIGAATAASALVAMGIATHVSAIGGFGPALSIAGTAFTTFATVAKSAILSIPVAGWVAAGVTALTTLGVALAATAEDEIDLANRRKDTARETINLIKAEKDRAEQAIKTQGATDKLTERVGKLNEQLIIQQKIISDANIEIYEDTLKKASEAFKEFAVESGESLSNLDPETLALKLLTIQPAALRAKKLLADLGEDYIAIEKKVLAEIEPISQKLFDVRTGILELTDEEVKNLEAEKDELLEINELIAAAANAQREFNGELENRKRLETLELKVTVDDDEVEDEINDLGKKVVTVPVRPVVDVDETNLIKFFDKIEGGPEDVDFFDDDKFADDLAKQEERLRLHFVNQLITEEDYQLQRRQILADALLNVEEQIGKESLLYLQINAQRIAEEKALQEQRQEIIAAGIEGTIDNFKSLMTNLQGINEGLFTVGKAAAIAQATADTYVAANQALATFPPPLSFISAAAHVAAGLANVAKISAVQFEKRAEGGLVDPSGRVLATGAFGGGENRLIIANDQEYIVNADSTRKYHPLLQAINDDDLMKIQQLVAPSAIIDALTEDGKVRRLQNGGFVSPASISDDLSNIISNINDITNQISSVIHMPIAPNDQQNLLTTLTDEFRAFKTDTVEAIDRINFVFLNVLDHQQILRQELPEYERSERERTVL